MKNKTGGYKQLVTLSVVISFILIGYPILIIFLKSLSGGLGGYVHVFTDPKNLEALKNSLFLSILGTLASTLIGCLMAWMVSRTKIWFPNLIEGLLKIQFFIPPFISALAWQQLLGPVGMVNKWYMQITGGTTPLFNIYGQWGILFVFIISGSVSVYMVVIDSFRKMQASLEEAAVITGASTLQVFKDITIPVLKPSILSSMLMVFMSNMSNYGVPSVLGYHVGYYTLTTRIYGVVQDLTITNNMEVAATLSMLLVVFAVLTLILKEKMVSGKSFAVVTGKSEHLTQHSLGAFNGIASVICIVYGLLISILPVLAILATSLTQAYGLPFSFDNMTLRHYETVLFNLSSFQRALSNSVFLALAAACISVVLALVTSYICVLTDFRYKRQLEMLITLPSAIPGTVMAIAIILAWIKPIPILNVSIYNTLWIILIAYVANYTAQAFRAISGGLYQISPALEEAAEISGAGLGKRMLDIIVPVMKQSITTAWFLIFIPCLRELTLSIFLWSAGTETLATVIFTLQDAGNYPASSALSIIIIVMIFLLNTLSSFLTRDKKQTN